MKAASTASAALLVNRSSAGAGMREWRGDSAAGAEMARRAAKATSAACVRHRIDSLTLAATESGAARVSEWDLMRDLGEECIGRMAFEGFDGFVFGEVPLRSPNTARISGARRRERAPIAFRRRRSPEMQGRRKAVHWIDAASPKARDPFSR